MANGDIYKGAFKSDKRHGTGMCQLKTGALYKGEWRDDQMHGTGILFSGQNEIIECRFDRGQIYNGGRIKMIMPDGCFYEGQYLNHERHGKGSCYYPNGDIYEGEWLNDVRVGRGKMRFNTGQVYQGQFMAGQVDGAGTVEDKYANMFLPEQGDGDGEQRAGSIQNGRLQGKSVVNFTNGDYFVGEFRDGRPNGYGELSYKHSVLTNANASHAQTQDTEPGQYKGQFVNGRRCG